MLLETAERAAIAALGVMVGVLLVAALAVGLRLDAEEPAAALTARSGNEARAPRAVFAGHTELGPALAAAGLILPPETNVYAAIVRETPGGVRLEEYEAGGGGEADDFWPASSLKQMAALGALEFLYERGFTGSAMVTFADDEEWSVRELYREAITDSDNVAYDRLVELAGVDWLNEEFLTSARGFGDTVIQKSYISIGPVPSGPVRVREGDRELELPPRPPSSDFGVPDDGNRSTLREMAESISRVVLDDALPADRRYRIDAADLLGVRQALLGAENFVAPGVLASLGAGARMYSKPGWALDADCVDVVYIESADRGRAFLLGISTPDDGRECATLVEIAREATAFLSAVG